MEPNGNNLIENEIELLALVKEAFKGRDDVVAEYWLSADGGRKGYNTICSNRWKKGICPKASDKKAKCKDCEHQDYLPLSDGLLKKHLKGDCILGVYPLLTDNTCLFIAADIDDHDGTKKVRVVVDVWAYYEKCRENGIPCYVLRSKSGNGFHAYIFFQSAVPAWKARLVAGELMSRAFMLDIHGSSSSFDRFFPNQDEAIGGKELGNLISLPFQGKAKELGNTIFLDPESGFQNAFSNQVEALKTLDRVDECDLDKFIANWGLKRVEKRNISHCVPSEDRDTNNRLLDCDFIKWCKDNPDRVSEPLWWSMITNVCRLNPNGRDLCHEYSKGHLEYSYDETEEKMNRALIEAGPHTCEYIKKNGYDCGKDCGVKSPIVLDRRSTIPLKDKPDLAEVKQCVTELQELASERPDEVIRQTLGSEKNLKALAVLAEEDAGCFELLVKELEMNGVKAKDTQALRRAINGERKKRSKLRIVRSEEKMELLKVADALPGAPVPDDMIVPDGWELSYERGLEKVTWENDNQGRPQKKNDTVCWMPVLITARLSSVEDGTEEVELSWHKDGQWRKKIVSKKIIAVSREITNLSDTGLSVTSVNASSMVSFLSEYEAINIGLIPRTQVSKHLGWQGEPEGFLWGRTFLKQDQALTEKNEASEPSVDVLTDKEIVFKGMGSGNNQIAKAFTSEGDYETWVKAINGLFQFPRVISGVYFSLAAPLLRILGAPNFVVDWSCSTSTGKTTTLRIAASCWGNPDETSSASVLQTWNNTQVGIERIAGMLEGLPLILDDTKLAGTWRKKEKAAEIITNVIYMVSNGRGKGRGSKDDGLRSVSSWKTIMLSTGEQPAVNFTQDGGSAARVITLWGPPFGSADGITAKIVTEADLAIKANYGHAGPKLVAFILKNRAQWELWKQEYMRLRNYLRNKAGSNPVAIRISDYVAVLAASIPIVHAALPELNRDTPPVQLVDHIWNSAAGIANENELDRPKAALQEVYSWTVANATSFWGRHQEYSGGQPHVPSSGWAGAWKDDDEWKYIAIVPRTAKEILEKSGYDEAAILRVWYDKGWLLCDKKRNQKQIRIGLSGESRVYCYCLKRDVIEKELGLNEDDSEK